MMTTALPRPVLPVWARPPIDTEGDCAPVLDTIVPGQAEDDRAPGELSGTQVGDRLRADLLPGAIACRDSLAALTVAQMLARADRLVREVKDPAWSPDSPDNALDELVEVLDRLRALLSPRAYAVIAAAIRSSVLGQRVLVAVRLLGERLAALPAKTRRPALAPRMPSGRRLSSSSLSRTDPPVPLRNVASWPLAIDDVQTVITR